tara:strand:+ start:523 stop:1443 length:921 start_codon:yes stop_codon:yes gene_type:complete
MISAAVFPGQGSQKVGMLRALSQIYPLIEETFQSASGVLGYDLWKLVQEGPAGELTKTQNTQPALLTASIALWRVWQIDAKVKPDYLAGHSLGEYSALVCAGVIDFEEAVETVRKRGELMNAAVPNGEGGMAALMGLEDAVVVECCENAEGMVNPANYNAPGQVVISGEAGAVDRAIEIAKERGAKRAVKLEVSGPFHSQLMLSAKDEFSAYLDKVAFKEPSIPVIQNVDAEIQTDLGRIRSNLIEQLTAPVMWTSIMMKMVDVGVEKLVECGPGSVLRGLAKRVSRDLVMFGADGPDDMNLLKGS